mmetsp:Transcript_12153/g.32622  ORF Transcript_12153/g.32622 Transcript_12153/m.32622 type:complete len:205 (+) Transcript_12153:585-1199(+)
MRWSRDPTSSASAAVPASASLVENRGACSCASRSSFNSARAGAVAAAPSSSEGLRSGDSSSRMLGFIKEDKSSGTLPSRSKGGVPPLGCSPSTSVPETAPDSRFAPAEFLRLEELLPLEDWRLESRSIQLGRVNSSCFGFFSSTPSNLASARASDCLAVACITVTRPETLRPASVVEADAKDRMSSCHPASTGCREVNFVSTSC